MSSPDKELDAIIDEDWEWRLRNLPEFATATGDHRYDDCLDDRSLSAYATRISWAESVLSQVNHWNDKNWKVAPSKESKVSARLLIHHCKCVIDGGKAFAPFLCPINRLEGPQTEFPQLVAYMKFESIGDYEKYLKRMEAVPLALEQVTDLLREGVVRGMLPPLCGLEGVPGQFADVATGLRSEGGKGGSMWRPCPKESVSGSSGASSDDLEAKAAALLSGVVATAFEKLGTFLETTYLPAVARIRGSSVSCCDLPNGAELYEACLRFHTGSDATAEAIHAKGLAEVERISAEMEKACVQCGMELGSGSSGSSSCGSGGSSNRERVKAFLGSLHTDPRFISSSAAEHVDKYRALCMSILPTLPTLFSLACLPRTPFAVVETPSAQAAQAPSAYYLGGAGDGTRPGTFFVNCSKLAEGARPFYEAEALSLHEAVPGHHTQTMLAAENDALPPFRRFMDDRRYSEAPGRYPIDGAFIEGWGLYSESLGHELGLYEDPFQLVGRLSAELFRACRLVVDTGLHSKGWTLEQAASYMASNTAASTGNIDAEVKRYATWPGQATGYKMGELEIWRLRRRFVSALEARGEKADLRQFHDLVLLNGCLPLYVVEELLEEFLAKGPATSGESSGSGVNRSGNGGSAKFTGAALNAREGPHSSSPRLALTGSVAVGVACGVAAASAFLLFKSSRAR